MPRLLIQISSELGSSTIIGNDMPLERAWACSHALDAAGFVTHITEDLPAIPLKALIKRRLASLSKPVVQTPVISGNVTKLNARARKE